MNLRLRFGNKLIAAAIMVAIALMPIATGKAFATAVTNQSYLMKTVSNEIATGMLQSDSVKSQIKALSANHKLDINKIAVKQTSKLYGEQNSIIIPIIDNTGYGFSKVVLAYDTNNNFQGSYLYVYNKLGNGNIEFTCITPSSTIKAEVTDDGGIVNGSLTNENGTTDLISTLQAKGWQTVNGTTIMSTSSVSSFWNCFSNCLYNQGIPGWVITTIGTVCAIACVLTEGLGCIACIYALTFATSFDFGACLAYCGAS